MKNYIFLAIIIICTFSCDSDNQSDSLTLGTGQGGSLAQFTIVGKYLYTVDESNLNVFSITNLESPVQVNRLQIGFDIETLFHYNNDLYIGSQTGMFVYSLENPENPKLLSSVSHFRACDPVVAKENYAFVTLDGSTGCGGNISALEIYDTSDLNLPVLITRRNLIAPKGLGLYNDNYLFVCDDEIKIFDIKNPEDIKLVHALNVSAFDVIIRNNELVAIGQNNLFQYQLDERDVTDIKPLSTINF